ncbi:MAG TPA: response regulator transcription factor [Anaerolineaceae bacterium]|jgi:two-component system alkaline phosphatase synthesis response regulator PhoP|nr:response regulator transcription factor [Anaerolineaceae bacterium]
MTKILIVEDELELAKILRAYLEKAGFTVTMATRGDAGLQAWEHETPDLVLLDLNLPGLDGLDVARSIRRKSETPLIMVTARAEEADRLIGLELGADDYIVKPFSPREVVARVRAVLRRSDRGDASAAQSKIMRIANIEIDLAAHLVQRDGQPVDLTPTEFNLLSALAAQPGRVFSRLQLLEAAQGVAYEGYERSIDAHIKNLRAKLEVEPRNPRYIETVFGVGYRFRKTDEPGSG